VYLWNLRPIIWSATRRVASPLGDWWPLVPCRVRAALDDHLVRDLHSGNVRCWCRFIQRDGVYETLTPESRGAVTAPLRSQVFPGLGLQPSAFWAGDLATMLTVLQQGLASPEHAAFVGRLQAQW